MEYSNLTTHNKVQGERQGCPGGHTQRAFAIYHTEFTYMNFVYNKYKNWSSAAAIPDRFSPYVLDEHSTLVHGIALELEETRDGWFRIIIPDNANPVRRREMLCATEDNNPHHNHRSLIVVAYHSRPTGFIFSVIDPRDQQLGWFEFGRQVEEEGWGLVLPSAIHSNLGGFSYYYYVLCFGEPSQSTVWITVPCKKDVETVKWSHLEEEGRYFEWRSLRLKSQKSKMELGN